MEPGALWDSFNRETGNPLGSTNACEFMRLGAMAGNAPPGSFGSTQASRPSKPGVAGSSPAWGAPQGPGTTEESTTPTGGQSSAGAQLPHPGPMATSVEAAVLPQPPPTGDGAEVWPLVIAELRAQGHHRLAEYGAARDAFGRAKYGTPLRVVNGRDALVEVLQEALDAVAYARQFHEEACNATSFAIYRGAIVFAQAVAEALDDREVLP
jgi:hypothetical protein